MEENKYIEDITEMKCSVKELARRVEDLTIKSEQNIQFSVDLKLLTATVNDLALIVKDLKVDMCQIQSQPAKKWNNLMGIIASTSIGAIVMYFITTFILK
jgi:Mg2+ and Co2+ transporter CorA